MLTRDQAVAELVKAGSTAESANAILNHALAIYSQSARTNYHMITGYKAGTCMGAYPDGITTEDHFTICRW
jgi:hypothetical protein